MAEPQPARRAERRGLAKGRARVIALAITALLVFNDPPLDATGNGTLQPPTGAVHRSTAAYDVTRLEVLDTPFLTLAVTFGATPNPFELPNGFSLPILELYLRDDSPRGDAAPLPESATLLPGSGMRLPDGETWHYALRLTGDRAEVFRATGPDSPPIPDEDALHTSVEGTTLTIATSLDRPTDFRLYGMVGAYNPFSPTGWQPVSPSPSPWAFSSPTQSVPVVDVLAETQAIQAEAIDSGVLPAVVVRSPVPPPQPLNGWVLTMLLGMVIIAAGVVARLRVREASVWEPARAKPAAERDPALTEGLEPPSPVSEAAEIEAALLLEDAASEPRPEQPGPEAHPPLPPADETPPAEASPDAEQREEPGAAAPPPPEEAGEEPTPDAPATDPREPDPSSTFKERLELDQADWHEDDDPLLGDEAWARSRRDTPAPDPTDERA